MVKQKRHFQPPGGNRPPSPEVYRELDALLRRHEPDASRLDELLGILTALVIGPGFQMPSQWLPRVFGEEMEFESKAEVEQAVGSVFALWNYIASLESPEDFADFLETVQLLPGDPALEHFCAGFARAAAWDADAWGQEVALELLESDTLAEEDDSEAREASAAGPVEEADDADEPESPTAAALLPILLLASRVAPCEPVFPVRPVEHWTPELHDDLVGVLPVSLCYLALHLRRRTEETARLVEGGAFADGPTGPVHRTKVGRNEPCPCGSGRKFKHCCGR